MIRHTAELHAPIQRLPLGFPMTAKATTIELPVSAYTLRILRTRYGTNIEASHRSNKELWELLQLHPVVQRSQQAELLTHTIAIAISGQLAAHIRHRNPTAIGLALHSHFIRAMYDFALAQVEAGREAWTALETWRSKHGVGEDDWGMDTTYRNWTRYLTARNLAVREKKHENPSKLVDCKRPVEVGKKVHHLLHELRASSIQHPASSIQQLVHRSGIPARQRPAITAWLLRNLSGLSHGQAAQRLCCTRTNAIRRHRTMQLAIQHGKPIAHRLARLLELLLVGSL